MKLDNDFISHIENGDTIQKKQTFLHPDLHVLKYKKKVFFKGKWNRFNRETRGMVIDSEYNVVVYPFTKVHNVGETRNSEMNADDTVYAVRKINGFLACMTVTEKYGVIVSTTGSIDSAFVDLAYDLLPDEEVVAEISPKGITLMFEIVHPNDPHIIEEEIGAYLIGARNIEDGAKMASEPLLDIMARKLNVNRPQWYKMLYADALIMTKHVKHEGFMLRRESDDFTLKAKSLYYLTTKFFARKTQEKLISLFKNEVSVKQLKESGLVAEEFFDLIDHIFKNKEAFTALSEQDRIKAVREYFGDVPV